MLSSETDTWVQQYYTWWRQWHEACTATIKYVLNVLAQVVVADSCCCRTFNGSDFLHTSQLSRFESCTLCTVTSYKHTLLQYAITLLTCDREVPGSDLDWYADLVKNFRMMHQIRLPPLLCSLQLIIQWSSYHSLTLNSLLSKLHTAEKSYGKMNL
jgi:hypothetical protein